MKKILIVDDNSTNLYMLEALLKGYGFKVISAKNGRDALEKARLDPPDLIVTDILMPVMDGYALCRRWKSDDTLKHIPLVFYTATYTGSKNEDFALSLGAERFIIKPQEPDILVNMLQEVLEENYVVKQVVTKPLEEEMEFFRQYNEILFKKLEKKMSDLEITNQELRILEERYRLSFEHASDVIYTIDTDLHIISISPSVEKMLGYKPEEFIGRPVLDMGAVLTPESLEQAVADISMVLSGETISSTVYEFIAKDGERKYGEVSGSPIMRGGMIAGLISVARDITERKQAEEKLRESEKKYRELYDFLPIPVYDMDFEANITSANRAVYETFRGTEEDLKKGFNAWQLLSPEDIDKSGKNIQRLLKGEQIGGTEYTFMRLDGSAFPAIVISSVIYSDGKPVGIRGAIIDITERRQAEEELRRMNAFLDSIVENIPDMVFLKDARELRFVRFNRAGEELLGYSRDDLLGKNDYDLFPKEQADFFTENDREVLFGKEVVDIPEESIQTSNKGERILHTKKVPILDAKGDPEYLLGISEDITDRKHAEEQIREYSQNLELMVEERTKELNRALFEIGESRDKIDGILKSVADGLIVTDLDNRVILMNRTAEDLLGVRLSDVINRSIDYAIIDKTLRERIRTTLEKREQGYQFDFELPGEEDHPRIMRARTSVIEDKGGRHTGIITIIHDVTYEREIDRMKTEFLSTAAHELRSPLTSIQGFSELLMNRDDITEDERTRFLSHINRQSRNLAAIISDLLDISRIESGRGFALKKVSSDIKQIVKSAASYFESVSTVHRFDMVFPAEPVELTIDPDKMEQVVSNIFSNAVKYSPGGGVIRVTGTVSGDHYQLSIEDEGVGMTPEQVEKVFDKFYRAESSNSTVSGTGLGMSIVKIIVEAHGGKVFVESEPEKGTRVSMMIPFMNEKDHP